MQGDYKVLAIKRLQIARGHIGGIVQMIAADREIGDILLQLEAVEASIQAIRNLLASEYLGRQLSELCSASCPDQRIEISREIYAFLHCAPDRLLDGHGEPTREEDEGGKSENQAAALSLE